MYFQDETGAVLAEFVLVATILLLLCMFCFELAMILQAQLVLGTAAREGARQAAVDGGWSSGVQQRVASLLQMGGLDNDHAQISVLPNQAAYGRPIDVSIEYTFNVRTAMLRSVLPATIQLKSEVVTRSERLDER